MGRYDSVTLQVTKDGFETNRTCSNDKKSKMKLKLNKIKYRSYIILKFNLETYGKIA